MAAEDKNSFAKKVTLNTPRFVDFADLNGDNIQDMVGVNGNTNANIEIYHGKADGAFELKTTLTQTGEDYAEYYAVFLEQLNADNIPDIVAVSHISGIVFISSPSGYVETTLPGSIYMSPQATLFEDFNNDGIKDLLFKNQLFRNNNNGTFTSVYSFVGNGGATATDFNNDNMLDIVKTDAGSGIVRFYAGKGDGTFHSPLSRTATAQEVIAHDLNNDGYVDIIAKGYDKEFIIFHNDETFSFSQLSTFQLSHPYYSVLKIFDFDHDGQQDLVTSNDNHIQYRQILQDGTFGTEKNFNVGSGSLRRLIVKDVIGEPFPDLIVMSGFGVTSIFSDKLNASLHFTKTEKVYDALPFGQFVEADRPVSSTAISYPGFASVPKDAGSYDVLVSIVDATYEGELSGTVSITKKTLTVDVVDLSITEGDAIPTFELLYIGFAGSDNKLVIAQHPTASTNATSDSEPGEYVVNISGGADENYVFDYKTGILKIEVVTGISEGPQISIFPNPATDKIAVKNLQWTSVKIYDLAGRTVIANNYTEEEISLSDCPRGFYVVQIVLKNGRTIHQRIKVI